MSAIAGIPIITETLNLKKLQETHNKKVATIASKFPKQNRRIWQKDQIARVEKHRMRRRAAKTEVPKMPNQ
ncbi:hypothetical protein [Lusitaniella coriacea]|uniref:hypothetical protein n=1 Tax=Lusitaniella coriacea TaxID=1983105 RepID=UPI001E5CAB17|nr:hypothetical protein [Lusitaniella coriacea]